MGEPLPYPSMKRGSKKQSPSSRPRRGRSPSGHHPPPSIGLALGSGSARGWCHIGILQELTARGIEPAIVSGCSMGALVGAAYVTGNLDALEDWARGLRRTRFLRLLDLRVPGGGLVQGGRLLEELGEFIPDVSIESLEMPFAAVATDLATGREVWLREGSLLEAVRASIAVPGLFTPHDTGGTWLVDGGLVNPVPVSLCRALGAQIVVGVNPFGDRVSRFTPQPRFTSPGGEMDGVENEALPRGAAEGGKTSPKGSGMQPLRLRANRLLGQLAARGTRGPGMMEVLVQSLNIMQDRLIRSRMAGDPPEVLLSPRLGHIALLDFDQAAAAIAEGKATVRRTAGALDEALGRRGKEDGQPPE